ncbi:zinc finger protein 572 isoform X1 [Chaetodon trifascialis]|uniref:zinc finger protein 572 isoform X1 n=1 Tax=Chaetodon trifascialis TaxID=109706 RepID=UPI00399536B1
MSIEYTIDVQLTELGYPDILHPEGTSVREASCGSTSEDSPSNPVTTLPTTGKERLLVRGQQSVDGKQADAAKQTSNIALNTVVSTSPPLETEPRCKPLNPAESLPHEQAGKGTALLEAAEPTVNSPTAEPGTANSPLCVRDDNTEKDAGDGGAAQEDSTEVQQDDEDDSDDSEVSEVYEDEENDEEEDDMDEEGFNDEPSNSGEYRCSVCDLQLSSKFKLQDHMNLHTGARPYCCAECGKRFCQIRSYRVHLRTHAQTKVDRLLCRVCLLDFPSQEALDFHLSRTHFEKEFYECDLCKRVFTSLQACEHHVQSHKCMLNFICEVCDRNFSSPKSLARHRKRMCYCNFKCTDCTQIFTKKNALLKHSFSHLGLLPYTCIRCRCHFRLAKLYRKHKCEPERIHCVACLREFLSQDDFQQHKKDTGCWGNQEPKGDEIRCLECGQRFDTSEELKKHFGAHQRVLKCAECGKGFRSALLLMSHMGGHAGKSPCLCQSCGLGFPHQQNYDSHLKTCGQTPQPASAPKKRQASKSSSVLSAPVNDCSSPGPVTESVSDGSGPPDGLWKLTLDVQPPAGANLVLFLPVSPMQSNDLNLPSLVSPTLPGPAMQVQPQHLGMNAALGTLNAPLDLVTGIKQDPDCETPLDLCMKRDLSNSAQHDILVPIKSEPKEFEISGEVDGTERQEFKNSHSKAIVQPNPGETDTHTEVKRCKMDPMDLSPTASSGLTIDIKNEPHSPALDMDSSNSC